MLNKAVKDFVIILAITGLLFFNLSVWHVLAINIILFVFYILRIAPGGYLTLIKFFNFTAKGFRVKILGSFASVMMLGAIAGAFLVFYKLTPLVICASFLLNGLLFSFLKIWAGRSANKKIIEFEDANLLVIDEMPSPIMGVVFFLALAAYGFYLLWHSRTGVVVLSPWQVINENYLYVYLLATFVLGILIFSNLKAKTILFLLFILTLLAHSYLPLTHELIYGADGWRHIASEQRILNGEPLVAVSLSDEPINFLHKIDLGRFSYSQFWSLSVILSQIFNVSLLKINVWIVPLLWALVFPILLFEFGRLIGLNKKEALFLSWLGLLPFAWQAGGSFSLPVNFGFLWWFLLALLTLKSFENGRREQFYVLIGAGIALFFGYSLYFLLFWLGFVIAMIIRLGLKGGLRKFLLAPIAILGIFFIPILELVSRYSFFDSNINIFGQIKQAIGNITGWYLATGPRTHDISAGNIILNQTPSYAFVSNALTTSRFWLVVAMLAIFAVALVGLLASFAQKQTIRVWVALMSASIFGGYIVSRYFLSGEQILSRRLDNVFALFLLALAAIGAQWLYNKYLVRIKYRQLLLASTILIFSLIGTAAYSLGPDTQTVSTNEYQAMQSVWEKQKDAERYCVIADTYPLLVLEAISAKKIIGGGFPINEYFAQPERMEIYAKMLEEPSVVQWKKAEYLTKADMCFLVVPKEKLIINDFVERYFKKFKIFGNIIVWEYIY